MTFRTLIEMSKANELFIGKQTQRVCVDRLRLSQISGCTT